MARRRVGETNWGSIILPIGILGIGGVLLYKLFANGGGTATGQNNTAIDASTAAAASADLAKSKQAGVAQITPDTTLNAYSDQLYQLLGNGGGPPVDDNTAIQVDQIVTQVNNATDWYRLVQIFGTKKYNSGGPLSACALTGLGCDSYDLISLLRISLPAINLANINTYFSGQNIPAI